MLISHLARRAGSTVRHYASSPRSLRILVANSTNPFVNLGMENKLVQKLPEEDATHTLYLFRNEPTVVIGRLQNAWGECRLESMKEDGVHLVRRFTGGGAVYQDLGNSIFSFLDKPKEQNIDRNNRILINALSTFGVEAEAKGRNDLVVNEKKISGSAFRKGKDAMLHHGTLLVDLDTSKLGKYLTPNQKKLETKGIKSVAARVLNLKDEVPDLDHAKLCTALIESFQKEYDMEAEVINFDADVAEKDVEVAPFVTELMDDKWRFGKNPHFATKLETRFDWGVTEVHFESRQGVISDIQIYSDTLFPPMIEAAIEELKGASIASNGIVNAMEVVKAKMGDNPTVASQAGEFAAWLQKEVHSV